MHREQSEHESRPAARPAVLQVTYNNGKGFGPVRISAHDAWRSVAIGAGALVAGVGLLVAIWLLRRPLALLALGIVIAEAMRPLVDRLERKLPRVLAVLLVFLALILVVAGTLWLTVPPLANQAKGALSRLPGVAQDVQGWLTQHDVPVGQGITETAGDQLGRFGGTLLELPLAISHSLLEFVLVIFISIYWLILAPRLWQFTLSLVPASRHDWVRQVLGDMGRAMGGYLRGTAIVGAILGITTYLLLVLIHVNYPAVLGMLTALLEFVPVLGATISMSLLVLVALSQSPTTALIAFVAALVLHETEVHILVPNIMAKQTDISPLLAVLAVFAGGTLGGVLGAILAIPLAAALRVFVMEVAAPAIRRRTGAAETEPQPR